MGNEKWLKGRCVSEVCRAFRIYTFAFLVSLLSSLFLASCSPVNREAADRLNHLSYISHYRHLDSTEVFARQALDLSQGYDEGRAEAMNNLAFVRIVQMRYDEAKALLDEVPRTTDNYLERLVAYVQQMRLCQRRSHNREFYDYRQKAQQALFRIGEERASLSRRQQQRLLYAESELAIVTSTYYYYVGLDQEAATALHAIGSEVERDTAQFLNYLYNVGSGGIVTGGTHDDICQTEFDYLLRCLLLAGQAGYSFFEANALESLAEHLTDTVDARRLMENNLPAFKFLNPGRVADAALPAELAQEALELFSDYGDVYQIAGAHRTLASCYLAQRDYQQALDHLHLALADSTINQAPDLVASIREQLSVAFSAVDDKPMSDKNRNIYLDLQENTRQDRWLEARAGQLEQSLRQMNRLLWAVGGAVVLLASVIALQYFYFRRRSAKSGPEQQDDREEELREQLSVARLHRESAERRHLEQRAKVSLVNSITPLIGRMVHEADRLTDGNRRERLEYICELTDKINEQNDVLTHWIQLQQGQLSLHIETFALQELFDFVAKSKMSFRQKGVSLSVMPTEARLKADKVLTLFMLNTLADNARKFTPEGGRVSISAETAADYVEISVADTGIGMDEEQCAHVFEHKIAGGHGFGLLNCKGIIEKYRKLSTIFSVCLLAVESTKGQGSRFYFRLPRGMAKLLVALTLMVPDGVPAQGIDNLAKASIYADSAYFSNINGNYERTLVFADSCRHYLNNFYRDRCGHSADTLLPMDDSAVTAPEIRWLHDSLQVNYNIILDIRNESAVAALALHRWPLYHYNNRIYTQLFKELSADQHLADYCRKMQQSETNKSIAILLLLLLFALIMGSAAWQVVVLLNRSARRQQEQQDRLDMMADELQRIRLEEGSLHVANAVLDNCLSTLKHETMYYPSRIRQLVDAGEVGLLPEVAHYYSDLYAVLSEQAMRQVEHQKLHLRPLDHGILGDEVLIGYLFELLRKQTGQKTLRVDYQTDGDKYVVCRVEMSGLQISEEQAGSLFTSVGTGNIPYLLCRQIVRDHGAASNRRGCAIRAELSAGGTPVVVVTLPRAQKTSVT